MAVLRSQHRRKFRLYCQEPRCDWASSRFTVDKEADEQAAYLELAHHNHKRHPAVFPRWNPEARAVEQQHRKKVNSNVPEHGEVREHSPPDEEPPAHQQGGP